MTSQSTRLASLKGVGKRIWRMHKTAFVGLAAVSTVILVVLRTSPSEPTTPPAAPAPAVSDVPPPQTSQAFQNGEPQRRAEAATFDKAERTTFDKVQVNPDGSLRAGSTTFRLYGVVIPPRKKLCNYSDGGRWACGQRAFIALRNLVNNGEVTCVTKDSTAPTLMSCIVRDIDVSEYMLREGLAELADYAKTKSLHDAAASAAERHVGLWAVIPEFPAH